MVDFVSGYYELMTASLVYIIDQIVFLSLFERNKAGWRIRGSRIEKYPNLRPLSGTLKVTLGIFSISLVAIPIISYIFHDPLLDYVKSLQNNFLLLGSAAFGAIFMIWHYGTGKGWTKLQVIFLLASFVFLGFLLYQNYNSVIEKILSETHRR